MNDEKIKFKYQGAIFEIPREDLISSGWFVRIGESDTRILLIGSKNSDKEGFYSVIRTYDFSRAPIAKRK